MGRASTCPSSNPLPVQHFEPSSLRSMRLKTALNRNRQCSWGSIATGYDRQRISFNHPSTQLKEFLSLSRKANNSGLTDAFDAIDGRLKLGKKREQGQLFWHWSRISIRSRHGLRLKVYRRNKHAETTPHFVYLARQTIIASSAEIEPIRCFTQ